MPGGLGGPLLFGADSAGKVWLPLGQPQPHCGAPTPLHRPQNPGVRQCPGAEGRAPQEHRPRLWLPEPLRMEAAAARPASEQSGEAAR